MKHPYFPNNNLFTLMMVNENVFEKYYETNSYNENFIHCKIKDSPLYAVFYLWNDKDFSFFGFSFEEEYIINSYDSNLLVPFYSAEYIINSDKMSSEIKNIILFNLDVFRNI